MSQATASHDLATRIFWNNWEAARDTQAQWDEMARECAEQGFRPEYCIHGTYMWVEWDCACGLCEQGEPLWDDARDWDAAKRKAAAILEAVEQRRKLTLEFVKLDPRNCDIREALVDWSLEPLRSVK